MYEDLDALAVTGGIAVLGTVAGVAITTLHLALACFGIAATVLILARLASVDDDDPER